MTNAEAISLLRGLEKSLDGYCELNDDGKKAFNMAVSALELFGNSEQLPSAQPEIRTQMSSANCISRQAAIDAISSMFAPIPSQKDMVEDCLEIIKNLPSAQTEIIRCKDCKYACIDPERESDEIYCSENDFWKDDDWFCRNAERRTDG